MDRDDPVIPPDGVADPLRALNVEPAPALLDGLGRYLRLLLEANQRMNLTAVRDEATAWRRLILDSLTLADALADLPAGARVIDIGSGGGVPGIPLAMVRRDLAFTLLEATGKKARFLKSAAAELDLDHVTVFHDRAEHLGQQKPHRQRYDAALARAVGAVAEILEYAMPLLRVGGRTLMLKGREAEAQLAQAGDAMALLGGDEVEVADAYPPGLADTELVIVAVTKARPTPHAYPRPPGVPRKTPL